MNILQVRGLNKSYPGFALRDVSFSLEEGKITGFIGRNGAGKTTVLKSVLGFLSIDSGDISFFGEPFFGNEAAVKQKTGYVSGGVGFYPAKKLKTITAVTRRFYRQWDDDGYRRCLERFKLDENKTPAQLSEGMKVKYAISLALSHHAQLLILDEPTSGLDPVSRDELLDIFRGLQEEGTTILFSTHITSDLDKCADNILYIKDGCILAEEDMGRFVQQYKAVSLTEDEYEAADKSLLIGCSKNKRDFTALIRSENAELVEGTVKNADLETVMIHLEKGEMK